MKGQLIEIVTGVWLDPGEVSYVSTDGTSVIVGFKRCSDSVRVYRSEGETLADSINRVASIIREASQVPNDGAGGF